MSNCRFCGQPLNNQKRFCGSRSCYLAAVRYEQKRIEDLKDFAKEVNQDYYKPRDYKRFSK